MDRKKAIIDAMDLQILLLKAKLVKAKLGRPGRRPLKKLAYLE